METSLPRAFDSVEGLGRDLGSQGCLELLNGQGLSELVYFKQLVDLLGRAQLQAFCTLETAKPLSQMLSHWACEWRRCRVG